MQLKTYRFLAFLPLGLATASAAPTAPQELSGAVAVKAGRIHTLGEDGVLQDATLIVREGKIVALGIGLVVPPEVPLVDFGGSAEIVPGFVAADSSLAEGAPSRRSASPGLNAVDGFDFYGINAQALSAGITSAFITPARGRLIAGCGAVVKLAGSNPEARLLRADAALHASISKDARNTPGYWEPPVPATVDVGLGSAEPQLPRTTMGALVALGELLVSAEAGQELESYGRGTTQELAELLQAEVPWRITAQERHEIVAALAFAKVRGLKLILHGAQFAEPLAEAIAAAGVPVIYEVPFRPNLEGQDLGKDPEQEWPDLNVPAELSRAGVDVAIVPAAGSNLRDLRFAAILASNGGLSAEDALASLTRIPAEIYGVADRVGSLSAGKDADFVVFSSEPLSGGASVLATYVDGIEVWTPAAAEPSPSATSGSRAKKSKARSAHKTGAPVVIHAEELHVGDGEVLTPGEVLVIDGRIAQVGRRVGRPAGASVVSGAAAMPGMIDALGHLGLEGSERVPGLDFDLSEVVEPGDRIDRRVALSGVTTVLMNPRGNSSAGAPILAYRPAAEDPDRLVVDALAAVRLVWSDDNRLDSGRSVRHVLEKAVEYKKNWDEYATKIAEWDAAAATREPERPEFKLPEKKKKEAKIEEDEEDKTEKNGAEKEGAEGEKPGEDKAKEANSEGDKPDEAKKEETPKKKKKKKAEPDPDPVTGIWVARAPAVGEDEASGERLARIQLRLMEGGKVEGFLRSDALSQELLPVQGTYVEESSLELCGEAEKGGFRLTGKIEDTSIDAESVVYAASVQYAGLSIDLRAERESREFPMAKRKARYVAPPEEEKPADGEKQAATEKKTEKRPAKKKDGPPAAPKSDPKLEPYKRAMEGSLAVIVEVSRSDEILDCVQTFEDVGIKPVLLDAEDAHKLADQLEGRVQGVLLSHEITRTGSKLGSRLVNRYALLQAAGIKVAFHSDAEEGARDLPLMAAYAVVEGMSPEGALRALTSDAAAMLNLDDQVGRLSVGLGGDVLLLDKSPLDPSARVLRVWVSGREVR